jgi:hypothetical protein
MPFNYVDCQEFKDFVMAIRPKYDRLTSWKLRNTFLEKGYSRMQNNITQVVSNPSTSISLVSDGWSNLRNEHMINYVIITPGQNPILYKTMPTNGVSQTAERIFHNISAVIDELGGESRVVSVVTDNFSTMQKAWGLIEEKYPRIYANGCAAHVLNLLVMDICTLQEFTQTMAEVLNICKFVKTRSAVGEEVRILLQQARRCRTPEAQTRRQFPKLAVPTRIRKPNLWLPFF